jgi:hypothetical protein
VYNTYNKLSFEDMQEDFREVIIYGIKKISIQRMAKSGQKGYFNE